MRRAVVDESVRGGDADRKGDTTGDDRVFSRRLNCLPHIDINAALILNSEKYFPTAE